MSEEISVTLCNPVTGQSETLPVSATILVSELTEWSKALLGLNGNVRLVKDGKTLSSPSLTLAQAGVRDGDLLAAMQPSREAPAPAPVPAPAAGLDFSNLLGGASSLGGGTASVASPASPGVPVYFEGMTLADAVDANPHPNNIVTLLQTHPNLSKELNYHNPKLAQRLMGQTHERAVQIWREDMVKGGIQMAFAQSQAYHKKQEYTRRLEQNPNDAEAKEYFDKQRRTKMVNQQYRQAMQEYPESMGRVLMLYIEAKINGHNLQAFVDSGAQSTIMSKKCATKCGIIDLVDTRFSGVAVGVGTGKILGRIHIVQLQIGHVHFPCSVTVMDDMTLPSGGPIKDGEPAPKDMDFLLGLDMLKRHMCLIDLGGGKLKFQLSPGQYLETPFLHEKDLDESKGGTKGFNAEKANQDLQKLQDDHEKDGGDDMTTE